ncbi:PmoA family protein [Arthrobacter castelli]|uniref:DUF6807 domain-containing protein n=1 Tax=Arthrobacter castelli TaxID=271431 RepID=UPI00040FBC1E
MPLEHGGAFMRVLDQVRTAAPPESVDPAYVRWEGEDEEAHPVLAGLTEMIHRATEAEATFADLGAPWAQQLPAGATARIAGRAVAHYQTGEHIRTSSSPRPYLHPVATLGGTVVSDHMPLDHVWHLGAGVAIQDVNDINFWGGRSYRRAAGRYIWRRDHGHIRQADGLEQAPDRMSEALEWVGPNGAIVLNERRNWSFSQLDDDAWQLGLEFTLSPAAAEPVSLGSPGSHGREQGGYGGFFWRLPPCTAVNVRTASATGEDEVHGAVAPWMAWTAEFEGRPATLIFLAGPEASDPWFVRVSGYPGVGLSLAWDAPVEATRENPLVRSVSVIVADGSLSDPEVEAAIDKAGNQR